MKRGKKLDAGNFPSWEERIDYQVGLSMERYYTLKEFHYDNARRIGELQGRADRAAANKDLIATRATVLHLVNAVVVLSALVLALLVFAVWSVAA